MPFEVGSTLIGAGSSLLNNLFGLGGQKSANKQNLRIARMNNEWSEKMMQKQMDYNTLMWNKQNDYNDPSNQVERLRRAGINPQLALGNITTGSAQSAGGIGLPSPFGANMQAFRPDFSNIGSLLNSAYQIEGQRKLQDEQARFFGNQADWYGAKAMADIAQAFANTRNKDLQSKGLEIQNKWADSMLGVQYINQIRQNQSMEVSMLNAIKQGVLMDKQIARYDEETNARIADLVASSSLKMATGRLTEAQLKSVIQDYIGKSLDNKEKARIFDYVVEQAKNNAQRSGEPQNIWQGFSDAKKGFDNWIEDNVIIKSKRLWKDTKRSFGLYW